MYQLILLLVLFFTSNTYAQRVGAICRDGTRSSATGRGACSHHGGVDHWILANDLQHHNNIIP